MSGRHSLCAKNVVMGQEDSTGIAARVSGNRHMDLGHVESHHANGLCLYVFLNTTSVKLVFELLERVMVRIMDFFEFFFRLFSFIFTRLIHSLSNNFTLYYANKLLHSLSFIFFLYFPLSFGHLKGPREQDNG
jgi:hypothetical protein